MPKKPGKKEPPFSKKQQRWAFAAEARGELPKGKAREWAKRAKNRRGKGGKKKK